MYYIFATCCPCRITRECLQDREREIDRGRLRPTLGVVSSAHELCTKATLRMPLPSPCHLYYLRWIHLHTLSSDDRQHNQRTDARFATSMMTRERGRVVHEESEIDDDDDDDIWPCLQTNVRDSNQPESRTPENLAHGTIMY